MLKAELFASRSGCYAGRNPARVRLAYLPRAEKPRRIRVEFAGSAKPRCLGRHLVVMVKAPVMGRVKTRLARGIGGARATAFYRTVTNNVLSRVVNGRCWHTYLAISPDGALDTRAWPFWAGDGNVLRFAQGGGDLGHRMQRVLDGMPRGRVVIIGSDIPMISATHIASAFSKLGGADAVIGPSRDGGYWLFGMARVPRVSRAFEGVAWSSDKTLSDTLRNLDGQTVARVCELDDVDEASDLARMGSAATRRVLRA